MYYTGNFFFKSKIKALEHSNNLNYYYYDKQYNSIDWTIEPSGNIQGLYKDNALRLREKYDYLILCFSGGYDSTQILETFILNNIRIDKIITVGAFSKDNNSESDDNMNIEAYKNAFSFIKKYNLSSIYETFDYTKWFDIPSNFSIYEHGESWIDEIGSLFSPHHFFWRDLEEIVVPNSWRSKRTGIIFGIEKPYLFYEDSNFYFCFRDSLVNQYGNRNHSQFSDRVLFFWDPTYPQILVKQLHLLKKATLISHKLSRKPINECLENVIKLIHNPVISANGSNSSPVYTIQNALQVKSPKSSNIYLSNRDRYLLNCKNTEIFSFYSSGIKSIKNRLNTFYLPSILSKRYLIGRSD
jgi:hypothetical protein